MSDTTVLTAKSLKSEVEIKWCAGCGAHAILHSLQTAMAESGAMPDDIAVVSGIGCSSRLPYYMGTYGFHGIHGRASAIATGLKLSNPSLRVWQISGDGDALAIGGNHFIHTVKRNIDINIIIFNNEIYGLTKGQFSPTTKKGEITKTSPHGHIEKAFNPGELTIGAQGNFFARALDGSAKFTAEMLKEAEKHKGTSVVEVLMNCVIFNDGAHKHATDKDVKEDRQLMLAHGQPMLFGKDKGKGIVFENYELKAVTIGQGGYSAESVLVHDATMKSPVLHSLLAKMGITDASMPIAFGVIRQVEEPTYESEMQRLFDENTQGPKTARELFDTGDVWEVN
jgi:2-oxoglutarate/2-oxoacid ferredoxin oxidoreductase subunit beta